VGDPTHPGRSPRAATSRFWRNCSSFATIIRAFLAFMPPGGAVRNHRDQRTQHPSGKGVNPHTFLNDCTFGAALRSATTETIRWDCPRIIRAVHRSDCRLNHRGPTMRCSTTPNSLDWTTNNDILQYVVGIRPSALHQVLNRTTASSPASRCSRLIIRVRTAPMAVRTDWSLA